MRCPACGRSVPLAPGERVGFRDECPACGADLHVCLACGHRDASAYNECREPTAERVVDKDRANRCEQFTPHQSIPADAPDDEATPDVRGARNPLDALFKK